MRRSPRAYFLLPVLLLFVGLTLVGAEAARALFTTTAKGGPTTVATATMHGSNTLVAEQVNCRRNGPVEIELQWSSTSTSYATSYAVERAASVAGPFTRVATATIDTLTYVDGSLNSTTNYYYRVSAMYLSWSAPSPVAQVTTLNKQCR
jgi:fibronectin type 3 domain-containing protein